MQRAVAPSSSVSLLDTFPPKSANSLDRQHVALRSHVAVMKPDRVPDWIYFPHRGTVVSLTRTSRSGSTVEVGIIGSEGVVGFQSILANEPSGSDGVVQISGAATRVRLGQVRKLFDANAAVRNLLLGVSMTFLNQVAQHVLCNRLHTIEQRLAKWLLGVRDRVDSDTLALTHDFMGHMLGIRRSGVTVTIGELEQHGVITHRRSSITIVDREGLEGYSCECYRLMRETAASR